MSIEKRVWDTLSAIDVSAYTERKQNLTYLSWAHAWAVMCQHYPATDYTFTETVLPDGTMMVECQLVIRDGDESMTRVGWLPCLDYRNKPITNPDAMQINTTRMRCLTKTLGLVGLGIGIYAGQDLPMAEVMTKDEPIDRKQAATLLALIAATKTDEDKFCAAYKIDKLPHLVKGQYEHAKSTLERKRAKMEAESGTEE